MAKYDNHQPLLKEILRKHNIEAKSLLSSVEVSQASLDRYLNERQQSINLATWLAIVSALPEQARKDYLHELFGDDLAKYNQRDIKNLITRLLDRLPENSDSIEMCVSECP